MPSCQNCNHQWSWSDTVIIGFKNNKNCPNCGERQYVAPSSQKGISLFTFIPLILIVFLNSFYDLNNIAFISFITLFVLGMLIYMPFTIKLSNEKKPLW
ncbi:TIGR04104 family putative zinc finger protein [uncultured Planococcus sp.]|uniref:TIGR04104 family putative zinc finger protein n=1 Tax=uncultured Planococcus sp. TaxID=337815 RepID=UPI0026071EA7|nr:TIGR04104 family putative zinc finger protein [uncultured Planococcus sp.]